jgi:tripartite-type tricarboxylate transporter receptor subunit TctC
MPDLPTIAESGYPGFAYGAWSGLVAPARTPKAIVTRLHSQITGLLQTRELRELIAKDGATAAWSESPEAFAQLIRSEIQRWSEIIKQTGARVE